MRFLWAIIALLVASGAFLMLRQPPASPAPIDVQPARSAAAKGPATSQDQAPAAAEPAPSPAPAPADTASNAKPPGPSEAKPATPSTPAASPTAASPDPLKDLADAVTQPTGQPAATPAESPVVAPAPDEKGAAQKAPDTKPEPKPEAPSEAKPDPTKSTSPEAKSEAKPESKPEAATPAAAPPPPAAPPANAVELPNNKDFPSDKVIPSKAVRRDDGALLLDDRFVLKGSGTKEDPYKLPWDLLVSAQEVYKPRSGMKKMPQRLTILHEKYVKITGFVAFPIAANNAKECLVMLNQWDGCCIGVPPTAFDAIEVRLKANANDKQRLSAHGTLEGRFRVDPYEDGGWVLGLYLMDDATLTID